MTGTWASGFATGDVITAAEYKKQAGAIFDSTIGASAASIDITGISSTYAHLMVSIYARCDVAATNANVALQFNGDGSSIYDYQQLRGSAAAASAGESFAVAAAFVGDCPGNTAGANLFGAIEAFIPNYAGSSNNKQCISISALKKGTTTGLLAVDLFGSAWRSNAAINRITVVLGVAGNFVAGTRVTIHALGA